MQPPLPFIARMLMPRELRVNALMAVVLGALEGGLLGVIVKARFGQVAEPGVVNLAVAVVAGAPAFANLFSLTITALAHGRSKTRWVAGSMLLCSAAVFVMALAPTSSAGLVALMVAVVIGRVAWSGVITLRAAIWRANFPRTVRARITGRIAVIGSLIIAASAGLIGLAMEFWPEAWRGLFVVAGLFGLAAAWRYRNFTTRGQGRMLRSETSAARTRPGALADALRILREDLWYRHYMLTMFVFGSGNLMVIALLVILLSEQFGVSKFQQVMITTTLPLLGVALLTPLWARRFDQVHILDYRAVHSWMFVLALLLFTAGSIGGQLWLFWLGALAIGAAFAGGQLGWNLGHNDFASDAQSTLYMGIHVTLTGVRGLVAPLAGVAVYQGLEAHTPGLGRWVLVMPLTLTLTGALMFVLLARRRSARHRDVAP